METIQVVATKINPAKILDIASPPASTTSVIATERLEECWASASTATVH